jgi:hypothetical protein
MIIPDCNSVRSGDVRLFSICRLLSLSNQSRETLPRSSISNQCCKGREPATPLSLRHFALALRLACGCAPL